MTTSEQIRVILGHVGLKITPFCNKIGVDRHVVADIYYGRVSKISTTLANAIVAKFPQFNLLWLLTQNGEPLVDGTNLSLKEETESTESQQNSYSEEFICSLQEQIEELKKDKEDLRRDKELLNDIINKLLLK